MPGMPDDLFDRGVRIVMVVQRRVELRKSDSWQNLSPELQAQMDMVRWSELVSHACAKRSGLLLALAGRVHAHPLTMCTHARVPRLPRSTM